jgi:uncharacterized protein YjcR
MINSDKDKIRQLRLEGIGYKGIAASLGISRDSVRSFCKHNGLEGNSSVVSLNYQENKNRNKICTNCGKPLKQKRLGRNKRFCSDKCRHSWWHSFSQIKIQFLKGEEDGV